MNGRAVPYTSRPQRRSRTSIGPDSTSPGRTRSVWAMRHRLPRCAGSARSSVPRERGSTVALTWRRPAGQHWPAPDRADSAAMRPAYPGVLRTPHQTGQDPARERPVPQALRCSRGVPPGQGYAVVIGHRGCCVIPRDRSGTPVSLLRRGFCLRRPAPRSRLLDRMRPESSRRRSADLSAAGMPSVACSTR